MQSAGTSTHLVLSQFVGTSDCSLFTMFGFLFFKGKFFFLTCCHDCDELAGHLVASTKVHSFQS